jgi:hypothetical protein
MCVARPRRTRPSAGVRTGVLARGTHACARGCRALAREGQQTVGRRTQASSGASRAVSCALPHARGGRAALVAGPARSHACGRGRWASASRRHGRRQGNSTPHLIGGRGKLARAPAPERDRRALRREHNRRALRCERVQLPRQDRRGVRHARRARHRVASAARPGTQRGPPCAPRAPLRGPRPPPSHSPRSTAHHRVARFSLLRELRSLLLRCTAFENCSRSLARPAATASRGPSQASCASARARPPARRRSAPSRSRRKRVERLGAAARSLLRMHSLSVSLPPRSLATSTG